LNSQDQVLRTIIENAPIGAWLLGADGRVQFVNRTFCETVGISEERFLAEPHYSTLYDEATAARCMESDAVALASDGLHYSYESIPLPDGSCHEFEIIKFRLTDESGAVAGLVGLSLDITERRSAEERLRLLASVFENVQEGIVISDADGAILDINPSFTRITGYEREDVLGRNPRILQSGRHHPEFYRDMWAALKSTGQWSNEVWNRRKDGSVYPEWLGITAVSGDDGKQARYVGIFSDISRLKRQEEELQRLAHHDPLTGLPNRLLLADRMIQAIALTQRTGTLLAVAYLDLDLFKPINDRFGHLSGDALLAEVARRLLDTVRSGDTVARLGGDEFVLLLPDQASLDNCLAVFQRVLERVAEPLALPGQADSVCVTASLGISLFPLDAGDPDELLRHADQAMYHAKRAGRNRLLLFAPSHDAPNRRGTERLTRLRVALTNGEFELHYQPIVNMRSGQLLAAEGLVRWRHPERGLLGPDEFLHNLEGSDLELQFGDWVIASALEQLAAWSRSGLAVKISINITARNLLDAGFPHRLESAFAAQPSVAPERLQLEVVETAALVDLLRAREVFEACRALGVSLAIDDFGTGYSSLTYLSRLPVETIKIDKSFVLGMLRDPGNLVIVDGVIALANAFGLNVVAEGVETTDQGLALLRLGCERAQGFGIARPMLAVELPDWVRNRQPNPAWQESGHQNYPEVDYPLFVAEQWHREWVARLAAAARSPESEPLPALAVDACQVGRWISGAGRLRRGGLAAFAELERAHAHVHRLGQQLARCIQGGDAAQTKELMATIEAGRDHFVEKLRDLQREVSGSRRDP
jgi:diguanylate cyclase (GGDEF)-like protein/PAS domain S-box-containing protein